MTQIFTESIWRDREPGFYVELGAWNGYKKNSTYILETLGWDGVCIEPTEESYNELIKVRKCRCLNVAVYSSETTLEFTTFKDDPACNGIFDTHSPLHKERYHLRDTEIVKIKTTTWSQLNLPSHIDYLQLDTEGSELEILKGIDWKTQSISYICLEDNMMTFTGDRTYTEYMLGLGYTCILIQGVDYLWYKDFS